MAKLVKDANESGLRDTLGAASRAYDSRGVVQDAETKGVCVDDGWALMSRKAADAYFYGREWPARLSRFRC